MQTKRQCPICDTQIESMFSSFGINPREDAQCSSCGSLKRHRLIWLYIKTHTDLLNATNKKMLDVAPERIFQHLFSQHLKENYLSVDLNNTKVMIKVNITDMSYDLDPFDYICSHTLEYIVDEHPEHVRNYGMDYPGRLKEIELYSLTAAAGEIYFCQKKNGFTQ